MPVDETVDDLFIVDDPTSVGPVGPHMGMAYILMAYIVTAYILMAYIVMAYIVMAYIVMAYIAMAYIVMAAHRPRSRSRRRRA